jgi:hypothetical protein
MISANHQAIEFSGLDGSNLLAFMAALGTVRALSEVKSEMDCSLSWKQSLGIWRPTIHSSWSKHEALVDTVHAQLTPLGNRKGDVNKKRKDSERLFKEAEKKFKESKKATDEELKKSIANARSRFSKNQSSLTGPKEEQQARLKTELDKMRQCHQAVLAKERAVVARLERNWMAHVCAAAPFPYLGLGDDFAVAPDVYREFLLNSLAEASATKRTWADFAACFASDAAASRDGVVMDTAFRAVGGGQTRILNEMKKIVENTSKVQIESSLFKDWDYYDSSPVMRWDPNEHRPYALRANDPASDQSHISMRGANRLAIEALPLFPVMPSNRRVSTTGFSRLEDRVVVTWPIWSEPLRLDAIRTLLALGELQQQIPSPLHLQARGVVQAFRSLRFGKEYRNFSPASALL